MNILDQLVIMPGPLKSLPAVAGRIETGRSLGGGGDSRAWEVGPWLISQTTPSQAGSRWPDLCSRLSERGLLVECSVAAFEKVPVASIPRRLFRQTVGTGLNLEELQSADVVEITCLRGQSTAWGWPPEIESTNGMQDWIGAIKQIVGSTPVGLGVHAGVHPLTIDSMLHWPIDFITLHTDGSSELLLNSLALLRSKQKKLGQKVLVFVRGPLGRADHLIKILMLGASAVSIDVYLQDIWKSNALSSASSFLGAKLQTTTSTVKCPISDRLDSLGAALSASLQACAFDQSGFDVQRTMRALTPVAAQLAGLEMLGNDS